MLKLTPLFLGIALITSSNLLAEEIKDDILFNHDFLEIQKNYMRVNKIHKEASESRRLLAQIKNVNFAMKPLVLPIKPFDSHTTHYAYPLKIFLPKGATITSASLSNSQQKPKSSNNVVTVTTDRVYESGILDIVYVLGSNTRDAKYISIKLDKYVYDNKNDAIANKLYTQIQYFNPVVMNKQNILATLKPFEYSFPHSKVEYMGKTYDIYLVNIVKNKKVIKKYKDNKYINSSLVYKNLQYNYYVY